MNASVQAMAQKRPFPFTLVFACLLVILIVFVQYRSFRIPNSSKKDSVVSGISSQFVSAGVVKDGVPVIDHAKFERVALADTYLNNDGIGIAFNANGVWRFYPYQILVWHHAINDSIGSTPILVSYSPFAFSGSVFSRTVNGGTVEFGSSDKMYNNDLLLYDRATNSLWDQMTHSAIDGPMKGSVLAPLVSTVMSWNDFKVAHGNGEALSHDTGFVRDYTHDPYEDYYSDDAILFPMSVKDARLPSKELVYGIETLEGAKAYSVKDLAKDDEVRDMIGGKSVSIETDESTHVVHAYFVDATMLHLQELPIVEAYWFAWSAAHPKTDLYSKK